MIDSSTTVSGNELDAISLVGKVVTFRGYPASLTAEYFLLNSGKESVFITELPLEIKTVPDKQCFPEKLIINRLIEPGCPQKIRSRVKLQAQTTPGNYSGLLSIGQHQYKVHFEIYSKISLSVSPNTVQYQGISPGKTFDIVVTLKNRGNEPYTIPQLQHALMLDYNYLCKASSLTISGEKPIDFMGFLNGIVGKVQAKYAKPVTLSVAQAGKKIHPGEELKLDISLTLPKDVDPNSSYTGNFRIAGEAVVGYELFN